MFSSLYKLPNEEIFLEDLPSSIPRYKYEGGTQFCMIMDIEIRRLEKSMIAQVQQRAAPQEKTDHPGIKDDSLLSRPIQRGNRKQTYPRRVTRSFLKAESPNFISVHQPSDSFDQTYNIPDGELPSDCVLFYIPGRSIQSDILDSPMLSLPNRYSFDIAANLLLVKMVTIIHSDIGQFVNLALTRVITQMGLAACVRFYAGATIREEGRGKEGDQGWGPIPVPQGFSDKPTVTLEVGVSESHVKLRRDVDWWLHPAKGNANTTVTIKVDRKRPRLMIDRWERIDGVVQSTQQIEISKVNGQIVMANDSLTIPFESLFLRQPAGNETDITLDRETLQELADRTWRLQRL
ncbi:hypothetical protein N7447_003462 [Penicillium robsamsonii]|uniref:uncharacterized protein n=1 Tax=Penicillium robsamsonii TaxID=1792511 RepID=UPI0025466B11|nr:uncharacterized protein N7447_003462 [Penicillium robsamsonii]KAJ5826699.1 hypothetical protein N7447_003462 [Penicillium robsamsonii]